MVKDHETSPELISVQWFILYESFPPGAGKHQEISQSPFLLRIVKAFWNKGS